MKKIVLSVFTLLILLGAKRAEKKPEEKKESIYSSLDSLDAGMRKLEPKMIKLIQKLKQ